MIRCTVCGKENDDLSIVCFSCKSYLQGRVDALDLFSTIWALIESPQATFKRIVLAKHKNYTLLLSALFGVCLVLEAAWYKSVADRFPSLMMIVGTAIMFGPIVGNVVVFVATVFLKRLTRMFGGKATRRNLFAALAYATMPMGITLVFLVPMEIAVFGIDYFGTNPPPIVIRPFEYIVLVGLKGIAVLYTLILVILGTMTANAFGKKKLFLVAASVVGLVVLCTVGVHYVNV